MRLAIDLVGVLLIAANILLGLRYGLLRRGIALAGVFAGVGSATLTGNGIARFFHGSGDPDALYADAWAFIAITFFVIVLVELLGFLYDDKVRRVASLMFDRSAGIFVGAVIGMLEIGLCCLVALAVGRAEPPNVKATLPGDRNTYSAAVQASIIGGRVNGIETGLLDVFKPVLPGDLPSHLAESTDKSS